MRHDDKSGEGDDATSQSITRRTILRSGGPLSPAEGGADFTGDATRRRILSGLATVAAGAGTIGSVGGSNHEDSDVPTPEVEGPITGGIRTGDPQTASLPDVSTYGYVEEEYFLSGEARPLGRSITGIGDGDEPAEYRTRMLIYRPTDPGQFTGSVFVNWSNVTSQYDVPSAWVTAYDYVMREGHVLVALSAQKQGVDGSPEAVRWWDPERYGDLHHPGDEYSYDIFSQAIQALRARPRPDPDLMDGLQTRAVLGTGASQSAAFLRTYINDVQPDHGVVDGFLPFVYDPGENREDLRDDLVPILWINSEDEADTRHRPDAGLFTLWEMAGASHVTEWWDFYTDEMRTRDQGSAGGEGYEAEWDAWEAGQYGERGGDTCPGNLYPAHYVLRAGLHHLNEWVTKNQEAPSAPRLARDDDGDLEQDDHGNVLGGVRLPVVEVPVATYDARRCSLWGRTIQFDSATMSELYPTHEDYVQQMRSAIDEAVDAGWMLPVDGEDLMKRASTSSIGE